MIINFTTTTTATTSTTNSKQFPWRIQALVVPLILGSLTKADKEMIIVATSAQNNCLYCIVAHGALQRIYSKNPRLADQVSKICRLRREKTRFLNYSEFRKTGLY